MHEISFTFGVAIYGIIWFLTLFVVLPFGVRTQAESGNTIKGSAESAPSNAHIGLKLFITTLLAGAIYGGFYYVTTRGLLVELLPFADLLLELDHQH